MQILLRELQTTSVSADMAADAMASVVITAPSKTASKEGTAQVRPSCCFWSQLRPITVFHVAAMSVAVASSSKAHFYWLAR